MSGPAAAAGALLVDRLHAAGVTDWVLAPGSRSAPLALALAAAERAGRLRLHVRLDERSAGFLALGMARVSGRPVAVGCTSGTAVANLLPAVLEARYSGVPLVVVTADRPPEARGRGASQTIDQAGLFDRFVLGSRDLPVPGDPDWVTQYAAWIDAAVALAARSRGPVHLNAPFRPPLVSPVSEPPPVPELVEGPPLPPVPELVEGPPLPPVPELVEGPALRQALRQAQAQGGPQEPVEGPYPGRPVHLPARTLVIAGDLDVWDSGTRAAVAELAATRGWPIVWEASSGLAGAPTAIPHGTLVLADPAARARLRPDAVLTVGPFGLDRGVLELVRSAAHHVAVRLRPRTDPPDPVATAAQICNGIPNVATGAADPAWLAHWRDESAALERTVGGVSSAGPTVADVARLVWSAAAPEDLLLVAASLAIRQVAAFATGPGPHVVANRGANGIDGLVSSAWGAALAWPGATIALLGDLAFLHDHNGLLVPQRESRPDLTFVVADNNGGGIFRTLEQGAPEYTPDFDRLFGTPHDRDLVAVARAAGVIVTQVPLAALAEALADPGGVRVLIVPVADSAVEADWLRAIAAAR